jgi:hypothetical protein
MNTQSSQETLSGVIHGERLWFRTLFAGTFVVVLMIAMLSSLFGINWRSWFPGTGEVEPLWSSVRSAVGSALPLMFTE